MPFEDLLASPDFWRKQRPHTPPKDQLFLVKSYSVQREEEQAGHCLKPVMERKGTSRLYFTKYFHSGCVCEEWLLGASESTRNYIKIWFKEWGEIQTVCDGKQTLWSIFKIKWVERQILITALFTVTKQRCCWSDPLEESSNKRKDLTSVQFYPHLCCVWVPTAALFPCTVLWTILV